jgi:hypothetical protein
MSRREWRRVVGKLQEGAARIAPPPPAPAVDLSILTDEELDAYEAIYAKLAARVPLIQEEVAEITRLNDRVRVPPKPKMHR